MCCVSNTIFQDIRCHCLRVESQTTLPGPLALSRGHQSWPPASIPVNPTSSVRDGSPAGCGGGVRPTHKFSPQRDAPSKPKTLPLQGGRLSLSYGVRAQPRSQAGADERCRRRPWRMFSPALHLIFSAWLILGPAPASAAQNSDLPDALQGPWRWLEPGLEGLHAADREEREEKGRVHAVSTNRSTWSRCRRQVKTA